MLQSFPVGVSAVLLPDVSTTTLPSFASLTFTASGASSTTYDNNSGRTNLDTSATYQVILAPIGIDATNGGYTVGRGSPSSGALTLTSSLNRIKVSIASADLIALGGSVAEMFAISIWLKTGAGNFVLTDHAYVDPSTDFVHMITTKPRRANVTKTISQLQSTTADTDLGDRNPKGCTFRATPTTTGGVTKNRSGESVEFRPDNAGNVSSRTSRTVSIEFSVLAGDLRDVVLANAGTYVRYTHNSVDYEESQMTEFTTQVSVPGCKPLILVEPPDGAGFQAITCYLGQVLQNQGDNQESRTKDNQTETSYVYAAFPNDTLTNNMNTELGWKKRA